MTISSRSCRAPSRLLAGRALVPLLASLAVGCAGDDASAPLDARSDAGLDAPPGQHDLICAAILSMAGQHAGFDAPGAAGAPRWGIPPAPPPVRRIRRSWSTLSAADKKKTIDAFLALKRVTVTSGDPGSPRANYASLCAATGGGSYERNLYDYYVEAHSNAFVSMMTPHEEHHQMAHQGPQFLVWHRYLLLRLEADLAEAIDDPDFALPYWDWTDCSRDGVPATCPAIFEPAYLGSAGACDRATASIQGYLTDQGFRANFYTNAESLFTPASIVCGPPRPIVRAVGCSTEGPRPPTAAEIQVMFARRPYDTAPYDSCATDEDTSFRQYLEGFSKRSLEPICIAAGCGMHGRAHNYVGGEMNGSSAAPNDPIFFLNHANVDRLWAAWQEANLASGDPARAVDHGNPDYPAAWRGPLFNWPQVSAAETFDYKGLGYQYDTVPRP